MRPGLPQALVTAALSLWLAVFSAAGANAAASPAEGFLSDNIHAGLTILNDRQLTPAQRSTKFQDLLLGVTDLRRIALFTLGSYAASASDADREGFATAFQNYAVAVYRSYFQKYSGQTLDVTGSHERAPGDYIVNTSLADPSGGQPLEIDFRVNMASPKPVINDLGVAGVWLVLSERDDFGGFLSQHKGDIAALSAHLNQVTQGYQK